MLLVVQLTSAAMAGEVCSVSEAAGVDGEVLVFLKL